MSSLVKLFLGEMKRMVSYKILPISVATSMIWVVLFSLLSAEEARRFAPLLLYTDAGVMSLLLAGAFHHLERIDGTVKTMMVLPVSTGQIILAKALAAAALGLISALVVSLALYFLHGITLRYLVLLLTIAAAAMAHAAIGLVIALKARDFSGTLGGVMLFIMLIFVPAILLETGLIPREPADSSLPKFPNSFRKMKPEYIRCSGFSKRRQIYEPNPTPDGRSGHRQVSGSTVRQCRRC